MADRNVEDVYPISPIQEGILFDHELDMDSLIHWNQTESRIKLNLNQNPVIN